MGTPSGKLCVAGRHPATVTRWPCCPCEIERLHGVLVDDVIAAYPVLAASDVAGCVDAITGSIHGLRSFARQFTDHRGGMLGHPTHGFHRLLWALHAAGATDIALPVCDGCGATPKSMGRAGIASLCTTCLADRNRRACVQCETVAKVGGIDGDGQPLCRHCHTLFVIQHRSIECASCRVRAAPRHVAGLTLCHNCEVIVRRNPTQVGVCSHCGQHSHLVARDRVTALCRTCSAVYVTTGIVDMEPGIDPARIEAILSGILTHRGMLGELAEYFLSHSESLTGPDPSMPAVIFRLRSALCDAGAVEVKRWTCVRCGDSSGRRVGELCLACHRADSGEVCATCGEIQRLARRGPKGESFCDRCARRAVVLFERCGQCGQDALPQTRTADGPLCARCTRARYTPPDRPCCRCEHEAPTAANWPDGAVCFGCYQVARTEWAWCKACGGWKITPGRDEVGHKLCTRCSGLLIDLVCPTCGKENGRWTATQCPRCFVHAALEPVLHDADGRISPRLVTLHEVLTDAMTPAVVEKWLKGPSAIVVATMALGKAPLTHDTLDQLRLPDGRDRHRMLRSLLVTAGALEDRNEAIAGVEWAIDRDLARLEVAEADKACLRHYAHFDVLRKLRRTQEREGPARAGRGTAAGKWKAAVSFVGWLGDRDVTLSTCTQSELDSFLATSQGRKLAYRVEIFVNWARPRGHIRDLRVPTDGTQERRYDQLTEAHLLQVAAELIDREDWDLAPRFAGLLVVLFGLTLPTITGLRCSDLAPSGNDTEISVRGFATTLPAPIADLALRLADRSRRPGSSTQRWLFPGRLANQPISLSGITKQLAKIGFPTMLARNAARRRLTGILDPDVMRRITDIGSQTANHLHAYYSQPALDRMSTRGDGQP